MVQQVDGATRGIVVIPDIWGLRPLYAQMVDDLAARIDKIESVEDALAFLQRLTPDDRRRLAQSNTPLAAFADVQTPEQAMARLQSLDAQHRMQLLAIFQRVEDH